MHTELTQKEDGEILLVGKDIVEHELSIKNNIGVIFDDLHVQCNTQCDPTRQNYEKSF